MADPIATVEMIARIAVAINEAVRTAQRNIKDCDDVKDLVSMASSGVKVVKETGVTDRVPELSKALGHLKKTLKHALSVVKACQEDQNFVQRVFMAEDLWNQLAQVKDDIVRKTSMANFAINTYMMAMAARKAGHAGHQLNHHQVPFLDDLHSHSVAYDK